MLWELPWLEVISVELIILSLKASIFIPLEAYLLMKTSAWEGKNETFENSKKFLAAARLCPS